MSTTSDLAKYHLTQARAELAATRSAFCSHGVPPERCADHRPSTETTEENR